MLVLKHTRVLCIPMPIYASGRIEITERVNSGDFSISEANDVRESGFAAFLYAVRNANVDCWLNVKDIS